MQLTTHNTKLENPTWDVIKTELDKLDGINNMFLILENENGDYVQCAGSPNSLTVEYRINSNPNFKHFVIGKGGEKSPLKVNWKVILTNSGQIMVHEEEVLNLADAEIIFREFFTKELIPIEYNKRNVTKLHL